jgi:serine/threonine-protein kinase
LEDYTNKRIDGRYEIQELIGVGGMACVYRAYDNIDDRIVAVKILKDEYITSEDFRQRFKNESKVIAILSHPNIVKVYDVSYGDRLQYIVMEYVEGITLKEYIRQQGRLQPREVIHFTAQILRALQHAHDKGIVHRDVKPQNILLLANGAIKVTDFGIARFSTGLTKSVTESAIGSVHYISPEQARGDTTDDKADIYSAGIVLYEMLTGSLPFQSENSVSVAMMQIQNDPTPPRQINPEIPAGLEQMTLHAMRKNPKERYQSAAEMILDLEELRRNPSVTFDYGYSVDTAPTKYVGKTVPKTPEPKKEDEEYDKAAANHTVPIIAGVVGAVVLVVLVLIGIFAWPNIGRVEVPDFKGLIYEKDIKTNLQDKKYKNFVITTQEGTTQDLSYTTPGQVYMQSITPKTRVKKGTAILLNIIKTDTGKERVKIPESIIGMTLAKAEDTLKELGLNVKSIPDSGSEKDIGKILRCEPEVGTEVEKGGDIQIWYAFTGQTAEVPNLVRTPPITIAEAIYYLEEKGFKLDQNNVKHADSVIEKDRIIAQTPSSGSYPVGSYVKVTLSTGKASKSDLAINLTLPDRNGIDGEFKVYINNELVKESTRTLSLDGNPYTYTLTNSGTNKKVTAKINNWQVYSATVDFTTVPPKVTNEVIANPDDYNIYLPDVVGTPADAGIIAITGAGFDNPTIIYREVRGQDEDGMIVDQSPRSGSNNVNNNYFPRGTKITITVGHYTPTSTTPPTSTTAPPTTPVNVTPSAQAGSE